jgi:oligogalacturonide transport system substrate-binding protein
MKHRLALFSSIAAFSLLIGCSDTAIVNSQIEQTEISFSWWGNDVRNEYTIQAIKKFEELHPDISVKCNYSEWVGFQTRNDVKMASNTEADVMQINYAWLEQYSSDGEGYYDLYKLSDYFDFSNFTEEELDYGIKNGHLNAVPIALNTQTVYINKTIYDEYGLDIPTSYDDFFEAAKVMNGECYPISMTAKTAWFFCTAYAEQKSGKQIIDDDGNFSFGAEEIEDMLQLYCDLINNKVMPQVEYFDKLNIESGEYAGVIAWLSDASGYCSGAIDNGYDVVVADYTSMESSVSGWYAKPATMYAVSKNTESPEAAAMLLDYLMNSSEMAEYQGIEKGIPLSKSAQNYLVSNDMLNGIQYDAFLKLDEYKDEVSVISPYFENEDMMNIFKEACNDVLYGKVSLSDKAALLEGEFSQMLE